MTDGAEPAMQAAKAIGKITLEAAGKSGNPKVFKVSQTFALKRENTNALVSDRVLSRVYGRLKAKKQARPTTLEWFKTSPIYSRKTEVLFSGLVLRNANGVDGHDRDSAETAMAGFRTADAAFDKRI